MPRARDLTGMRFGMLTVQCLADPRRKRGGASVRMWHCACDCGKATVVASEALPSGATQSCGCLKHRGPVRHGMAYTAEYHIWKHMRDRCLNPRSKRFSDYGGRGIGICDRWSTFEEFITDMGLRPSPKHTIERIDNDGNYAPANCRWAHCSEQARNTRRNVNLTLNGETRCLSEWACAYGLPPKLVSERIGRLGWTLERALSTQRLSSWRRYSHGDRSPRREHCMTSTRDYIARLEAGKGETA